MNAAAHPSRVRALRRRLLAWWDAGHRELPWRTPPGATADAYRIWVSEVLLQQTRADAAAPYYARFLARFPTLESLAGAREADVLAAWAGLGYYARARNLHRAARETLQRHGGIPASVDALRALPGFGPYTAGAVASLAFRQRAACVDGNVARVLARVFAIDAPPAEARRRVAALADALVPAERPGDWNQALMDLGATVCAKPARCERCPLARLCEARLQGRERALPPPRARPAPRPLVLACAVVRRGDALLVRRREFGLFAGLWELPSVEVPAGAEARAALAEDGFEAGEEIAGVERALTHRRLVLRAFACRAPGRRSPAVRWARAPELVALGTPTAMRRLVEAVVAAEKTLTRRASTV